MQSSCGIVSACDLYERVGRVTQNKKVMYLNYSVLDFICDGNETLSLCNVLGDVE